MFWGYQAHFGTQKNYATGTRGHKIIDLGVISWTCMPNMPSISYGYKVIAKVKADNRQTDWPTGHSFMKREKQVTTKDDMAGLQSLFQNFNAEDN